MDIGKYAFAGSVRRRCSRGEWTGMKPVCYGLNQENDFASIEFIFFFFKFIFLVCLPIKSSLLVELNFLTNFGSQCRTSFPNVNFQPIFGTGFRVDT